MENLKAWLKQLAGAWRQLGLNQKVSVLAASTLLLAGISGVAFWSNRVDYALLYGKLDEAEAGRVASALDELKIAYQAGSGSIRVPADKVHHARMQLAAKGIPRGEGVGFEIFDKANFGISDFVQRANYVRAVQGELARTISQLDGVDTARVMLVVPENRLLVDAQKHPTASVFVRTKSAGALANSSVSAIRFLVANAVEGLSANHVTVVDNKGNVLSANSDSDSLGSLTASQLSARREVESYLGKKAEGMLEAVLGPGQAVVRVAAEINFETITRVEEKFDPDGQVARSTTVNDENMDATTLSSRGGVPGIASNSADTNTVAESSPSNNSKTRKKVTNNEYEINRTTSNILQTAGGVKRVSAAVFVAAKMEGTGTDRKAAPRTPEELQRLTRIVQSALGIQNDQNNQGGQRKDEITLEEIPFNDQFATEMTATLVEQDKKQFWWDIAMKGAQPALALVVLLIFFRALKKTSSEGLPVEPEVDPMEAVREARRRNAVPAAVTPEVLNRLIRENPDNMTEALRNWMARSESR